MATSTPQQDGDSSVAYVVVQDPPSPSPPDQATPLPPVPFSALYRYASRRDKLCLALALLCAGAAGALFPCMALIFGNAIASFQRDDGGVSLPQVNTAALHYLYLAASLFVLETVSYVLLTTTAERQMKALRTATVRHLLYMDMGWFDAHDALQLATRLTGDTVKIQDGMGKKLGEACKYVCQFAMGYAIGLWKGWDTTLVMAGVMPLMALSLAWLLLTVRRSTVKTQDLVAQGGAIAEETLGGIRTVASLTAERRAIHAYNANALAVEVINVQTIRTASIVIGLFAASTWFMYAAGLWYGGTRVAHDKATPAEVFQGFFGVLLGTLAVGQVAPSASAIAEARGAAAAIYAMLATPSAIDASVNGGVVPASCHGRIEACGISFAYPSRPDALVLDEYSVTIEAGTTVAFVGTSGGGKSTLVALLERFYNPQRGQLLLDGRDIATLNLQWLRAQIGVVSQEPVLFAQTIMENILAGGTDKLTRADAVQAAKRANAHDFIMRLPQQYETLVGEKGVALSGGQKQRIAIARALVRNPKILVLDEATSALDAESERVVQHALQELMSETEMTTLVIAHRLSTVRRADWIVVVANGRVVEQGTHAELMAIDGGDYKSLYATQAAVEQPELAEPFMQRTLSHRSSLSLHEDGRRGRERLL
jgi:ATP-binding cassette, subfamily B (MDR/TAP), member 1